ncbi:hypothetical protein THRCLA_11398 [Thraustotheca clavata]|uniref:HSF-type DNA-binding domain-containing protein n=1 Tax=Thraustotheca clavata TaxID=74557 RepID=A0A1V9Y7U9_9STRA|nr:hypothetical protein THRCLA_11398 [Thraustotheca clavata]
MAGATNIASGFIRKLYLLLDQEDDAIITWDVSGKSFSLHDLERMETEVLPRYSRGKLGAFHQQLLDHGFKWHSDDDESGKGQVYSHPNFVRGQPELLKLIVRIPQPKCKTFPKFQKKRQRRNKHDPYQKAPSPPENLKVAPGSHEEFLWKAINYTMYSKDTSAFTSSLLNVPGFTPSMVQLTAEPTVPVLNGANPLFATATPTPAPFAPAKNPLFDTSTNPLLQKTPSINPLLTKSISSTSTISGASTPPARNPLLTSSSSSSKDLFAPKESTLFKGQSDIPQMNEWQHLLSSSVDRFMQSTDKFTSAEDTFKFIMEERSKIATDIEKLPDDLFSNFGSAPDALCRYIRIPINSTPTRA